MRALHRMRQKGGDAPTSRLGAAPMSAFCRSLLIASSLRRAGMFRGLFPPQ